MSLWDLKSQFYDGGRSLFPFSLILTKEIENLTSLLAQLDLGGRSTLDAGTGTGVALGLLPADTPTIGVDLSLSMIQRAKGKRGTNFVVADVTQLPFKARSFGLITAIGIIEYQKDQLAFLRELHRASASHGFVLLTYAPRSLLNYLRLFLLQQIYMLDSRSFTQAAATAGFAIGQSSHSIIQHQVLLRSNGARSESQTK